MRICHSFSEPGGFKNPHTFTWHASKSPQRVGPGGMGKHVLAKASSIILMGQGSLPDWRRHTAPLESPATMSTCSCTSQYDCKQHILSIATLLSEMVVDVKRHHGKVGLAITQRKHVPVHHSVFFNGTDSASSRSRMPAQDAEACLLEQTLALPVRDGICVDPPLCRGTSQGKYGSSTTALVCVGETVGKKGDVDEMGEREHVLGVSVKCGKE